MTHTADRGYPWQLSGAQGWSVRARAGTCHRLGAALSAVRHADRRRSSCVLATASTHTLWFGFSQVAVSTAPPDFGIDYVTFSVVLMVAWMLALAVAGTRDSRILGTDSTEYRRIINATLAAVRHDRRVRRDDADRLRARVPGDGVPARHACCCWLSRWSWRRWLHAKRRRGELSFRVLLDRQRGQAVRELIDSLAMRTDAGYRVVAAVVTDDPTPTRSSTTCRSTPRAADDFSNTLAAAHTPTPSSSSARTRPSSRINELSWRLDPGQQLVVAPQLVGVAGSRIHTRPVVGAAADPRRDAVLRRAEAVRQARVRPGVRRRPAARARCRCSSSPPC